MVKWKEYEKLATKIYTELQPNASVIHDDKIIGKDSGIERQIDTSIRAKVAGHNLLIIVQARSSNQKADINDVDGFANVVKDVRASKGVLISNAGFTKGASDLARNLGVDLCSLHDAHSRDWSIEIKLPLLWIELIPYITVQLQVFLQKGDTIPKDPKHMVLSTDKGKTRQLPLNTFIAMWNEGKLGHRLNIPYTIRSEQKGIELLTGKRIWRPIDSFSLIYEVKRKGAWLGYFSPSDCRGILNRLKDELTISYLNIGDIPMKRDESWKSVDDPEKVVVATKGIFATTQLVKVSLDGITYSDFTYEVKKIET